MSKFELKAEVRDFTGKEKSKKLRATGKFPAIVYGASAEPVSLTVPTREADALLTRIHGEKVLVDLTYGSRTDMVFVRNVQRDPVSEQIVHVDFYRVDPAREIETRVPVIPVGMAEGVKMGGLLERGIREIAVRCLPTKVPPHIEVSVEEVKLGHALHVRELPAIEGVKFLSPADAVVFAVVGRKEEAPKPGTPAEGAAAAAPAPAAAAAKA